MKSLLSCFRAKSNSVRHGMLKPSQLDFSPQQTRQHQPLMLTNFSLSFLTKLSVMFCDL